MTRIVALVMQLKTRKRFNLIRMLTVFEHSSGSIPLKETLGWYQSKVHQGVI